MAFYLSRCFIFNNVHFGSPRYDSQFPCSQFLLMSNCSSIIHLEIFLFRCCISVILYLGFLGLININSLCEETVKISKIKCHYKLPYAFIGKDDKISYKIFYGQVDKSLAKFLAMSGLNLLK